ncbi:hypothetical protein H8959_021933 [Pygathrix nigripes]
MSPSPAKRQCLARRRVGPDVSQDSGVLLLCPCDLSGPDPSLHVISQLWFTGCFISSLSKYKLKRQLDDVRAVQFFLAKNTVPPGSWSCHGRNNRAGLLWVSQSPPSKRRKLEKPRKPITFVVLASVMKELSLRASSLGSETAEGIVAVTAWIEQILTDLKVQHKRVPCGKEEVSLFLTAIENSWIHLRRKKRERVRQLREVPRAPEDVIQALEEKKSTPKESGNSQELARGPWARAPCGPALREGEPAAVEGPCPSQESLSQEENPEPTEDGRKSASGLLITEVETEADRS